MVQDIKTVCIIGLGYIGLPTAVMIASSGMRVLGVDVRQDIVDALNNGGAHFSEPGLDELLSKVVADGSLRGHVAPQPADCFIIAVPTPFYGDHSPDLSYVDSAARSIAKVLKPGDLVILESTSPVGTTERVAAILQEENGSIIAPFAGTDTSNIHLAYCPERILPGQMMQELVANDRIIGGVTQACTDLAKQVYGSFCKGKLHGTHTRTAEMVKLVENSYRDLNIAFANEISILCDKIDVDVWDAIRLANCHPRVNILSPGCGVGGHCIAVDPWFLIEPYPQNTKLMRVARDTNDFKRQYVLDQIETAAARFNNPVIACLGVTYKPNVGDIRESPALHITNQLAKSKTGRVLAVDPTLDGTVSGLFADVELIALDLALEEADIVAILVNHSAFGELSNQALAKHVVIDSVGLLHQ
jgi:UDP-N-acetyl-D-mannosaminuronic acid dehydrogenase